MSAIILVLAVVVVAYAHLFGEVGVRFEWISIFPIFTAPVFLRRAIVYGVGNPLGMAPGGVIFDAESDRFFALMCGGITIEQVVGI